MAQQYIIFFGFASPTMGGIKDGRPFLFDPPETLRYSPPRTSSQIEELIKLGKYWFDENCKGRFGPFGWIEIAYDPIRTLMRKPELYEFLTRNIAEHTNFCAHCGRPFKPIAGMQKYCDRKECQTARNTAKIKAYRNRLKKQKSDADSK